MKNFIFVAFVGALVLVVVGGCYSESLGQRQQAKAADSMPPIEIKSIGEDSAFDEAGRRLGGAMLAAMKAGNYEEFIKTLPPEMVKIYTKEMFDKQNNELAIRFGKIESYDFVDSVDAGVGRTYIWKVNSHLPPPPGTVTVAKTTSLPWTNLFYINVIKVEGKVSLRGFREIPLL